MQVQSIGGSTSFEGHGARNISDVMNKLYRGACRANFSSEAPDIIQITAKMRDGAEVSAMAHFFDGKYRGLSFSADGQKYKSQFCQKVVDMFNAAVTKGKSNKRARHK